MMPDALLQAGVATPLLLMPVALALGALHALEPGHAKGLMAAFVIAVRGTRGQAVLLALSAALSHTFVVWALALLGFALGADAADLADHPGLLLLSGIIVFFVGSWTATRAWHERVAARHALREDGMDAHARAHAAEVHAGLAGRPVTARQVFLFGIGSGLTPCSAAVGVLLLCLQQQQVATGIALVAAFTFGLAAVLAAVGVLASAGQRIASRSGRYERLARHAPLVSGLILAALGALMIDGALARLGA